MKRVTKAKKSECPVCQGIGYTRATCTEIGQAIDADGRTRLFTRFIGSGCPKCMGTGQLAPVAC